MRVPTEECINSETLNLWSKKRGKQTNALAYNTKDAHDEVTLLHTKSCTHKQREAHNVSRLIRLIQKKILKKNSGLPACNWPLLLRFRQDIIMLSQSKWQASWGEWQHGTCPQCVWDSGTSC